MGKQLCLFVFPRSIEIPGVAIYRSGASRPADFEGYRRAGVPVGVSLDALSARMRRAVTDHVAEGGRVFVDSGAYGAFRAGKEIDFHEVMREYLALAKEVPEGRRGNLTAVAPDRVGDQLGSLGALKHHRQAVGALVSLGVDVVIPIQRGPVPMKAVVESVLKVAGPKIRIGIPANAAAMSEAEMLELLRAFPEHERPKGVHLLGIAGRRRRLRGLYRLIETTWPGALVSADACRLRASTDRLRRHRRLIGQDLAVEQIDFHPMTDTTEIIGALVDGSPLLDEATESLAADEVGRSVAEARYLDEQGVLGAEIQKRDPYYGIERFATRLAMLRAAPMVAGEARTRAVTRMEAGKGENDDVCGGDSGW